MADDQAAAASSDEEQPERRDPQAVEARLRRLAKQLARRYGHVDPDLLGDDDDFVAAVQLLSDSAGDVIVSLTRDASPFVASIALAAARTHTDLPQSWEKQALLRLRRSPGEIHYALSALGPRARRPVLLDALSHADYYWDEPPLRVSVCGFVDDRIAAGDAVDGEALANKLKAEQEPIVSKLVDGLGDAARAQILQGLRVWRRSLIDLDFFREFGRIVEPPEAADLTLVGARQEALGTILAALRSGVPRSALLVGDQGIGKSKLTREAIRQLAAEGWVAFEATASDVMAGQSYIGQLEGRVQQIAEHMEGRPIVWVFPQFEGSLWAGQHNRSPRGLLDALLPYVESGRLAVIGEIEPLSYEVLAQRRPKLASSFVVLRLPPLDEAEVLEVARDWGEAHGVALDDETLREAHDLATHYFPGVTAPGNVLRLLALTHERTARAGDVRIDPETIIDTLSEATGLPLHVLDPRAPMAVDDVRRFFGERVLGQQEAVDCLVERIALIKAGLTDPTRPLGVFLFVGPTGTGKTEIAKTLAEFLFGAPDRLVRLDMTEFQTPDSLERLLADSASEPHAAPLISSVRKQPFSVVLLDEFEKAHRKIWDVFLQVFDDGRLTDQGGRTVDFRHCVIILTSNVGSAIPSGPGLGFATGDRSFESAAVEKAVAQAFRPEFVNRLDRIVVFRPLDREVMRALLRHELNSVLDRRGFRMHPWAVEWDESAIDFLLERGFSAELGARPLKRAIEQHLLAPLALAIVERQFPQGDQFLFITAPDGKGIEVSFVDPDAPIAEETAAQPLDLRLESVVLQPSGDARTVTFLESEFERLRSRIGPWSDAKERALEATHDPSFWESDERFELLARIEYLDRLEAAARTAERLRRRLEARGGSAPAAPDLVRLLAERLFVLDRAVDALETDEANDVCLSIAPTIGAADGGASGEEFADMLVSMYDAWARRRGMRIERVAPGERTFVVSGLGAHAILGDEAGLHVLEISQGERGFDRVSVRVTVALLRPGPDGEAVEAARGEQRIVRRYRAAPSPLVRDHRGLRSGRLDRVLAGDFDVMR